MMIMILLIIIFLFSTPDEIAEKIAIITAFSIILTIHFLQIIFAFLLERNRLSSYATVPIFWSIINASWVLPLVVYAMSLNYDYTIPTIAVVVFFFFNLLIVIFGAFHQGKQHKYFQMIKNDPTQNLNFTSSEVKLTEKSNFSIGIGVLLLSVIIISAGYVYQADWPQEEIETPYVLFYTYPEKHYGYTLLTAKVSQKYSLDNFRFFLLDSDENTNATDIIAIHNTSGVIGGVESNRSWGVKNPNGTPDLATRAYDVEYETNTCEGDDEENGTFPVVFYDNDRDDRLSPGDQILVRNKELDNKYGAEDRWRFRLKFIPTNSIVSPDFVFS